MMYNEKLFLQYFWSFESLFKCAFSILLINYTFSATVLFRNIFKIILDLFLKVYLAYTCMLEIYLK